MVVAGPVKHLGRKPDEQRRGIDRPVVRDDAALPSVGPFRRTASHGGSFLEPHR